MVVVIGQGREHLAVDLDVNHEPSLLPPGHDEADRGGQAAADVQRGEGPGPVDLAVAGLAGHLPGGVVQHAHAGGAHRVAHADQAAAGVDRDRAVPLELAVLDRFPALAGFGDAEVIDGHVLRHREAVVGLDAVDAADVPDARAPERVGDHLADVREHVRLALAAVELGLQRQPGRAVPPAGDPGDLGRGPAPVVGSEAVPPELVGDQQHARGAVGDLGAVGAPQPPLDDRVVVIVVGEAARAERPAARLGQRVAPGVAHVELGDRVQVRLVQAVAAVVLVGQLAEHVRPHVPGVLALVADPGGRAEMPGRLGAGHVPLLLHGDHQHAVVAAGLDIGRSREHGHAARRAGRLVPGGRLAPQPRLDGGGHRAQLSLPGEQLPERVPDVDGRHVLRGDAGPVQRASHRFGHHVGDFQALARVVPREVALVAAGDPHAAHA